MQPKDFVPPDTLPSMNSYFDKCLSLQRWGGLLLCVLLSAWTVDAAETAPTSGQPNVVVILTDDQGWGDISLHGNPNIETPHIDSLARDGAQLRNFYVCPVCSPTRAEFLTGRYHARMGVFSTSRGGERFNLGERTIAESFRDGGYRTAAFGKWHSGMQGAVPSEQPWF